MEKWLKFNMWNHVFPKNEERQTKVPKMNFDDQIYLGLEGNFGEETVGEKNLLVLTAGVNMLIIT